MTPNCQFAGNFPQVLAAGTERAMLLLLASCPVHFGMPAAAAAVVLVLLHMPGGAGGSSEQCLPSPSCFGEQRASLLEAESGAWVSFAT